MNIMFQVGSWHYDKGGTDLFVKTISFWLARHGHKVVVLAHKLEDEDCKDENISVGKGIIKVRYTPKQKKGMRFNLFRYGYRLFITSTLLYRLAKKEKIKVVVVGETELLSVILLRFLDVKIFCRGGALLYETMSKEILKERGSGFYSKIFISFLKVYNLLTLKLPDCMIPVNSSEYSFMNKHKKKNSGIEIIPHGVDTNLFKPLLGSRPRQIIVGYVGRLAPIKHPELALKIFKLASKGKKNTEFWWVGPLDPSYQPDMFSTIMSKEGIKNARYFSKIDNTELPKIFNKFSIFLQVEKQKNVSRSTTEAASCGLPIVAINQGKEEYGFFTMNEKEAIDRLRALIESKELRKEEGDRARKEIIKNFSEDKIYTKYLETFNKIIKNGK